MASQHAADADLIFSGPRTLATSVAAGELSARELVEASLRRIERIDPQLNAFRVTLPEQARAQADALDRKRGSGARPLCGVPFAVKDDIQLAGQRVTRGSRSPARIEPGDAEVVRKLRAAGAIPIGVTNVPELMLFPWTASAANGVTRNPWNPERTPGGSSGGSAAAVAAGLVPMATASDGGGSIRIPAACCGLVGMKPSRGRVSSQPGGAAWLGLVTFGALTRTVADSALLLDVIHGALPEDGATTPPPAGTFLQAALSGPERPLSIAVSRKLPPGSAARLSPGQRLAWEQTARLLDTLGHDLEERDPDYGGAGIEFVQSYLRAAHEEFSTLADPGAAEKSTRQLAAFGGRLVSAARREKLQAARARTSARIGRLWDDFDVLLTPGLARTAIAAEGGFARGAPYAMNKAASFMPWFPVWNLTGQPALSLPAGFDRDGLPLSIQLIGRRGGEQMLYSLASQIEAARPWAPDRPPLLKDSSQLR